MSSPRSLFASATFDPDLTDAMGLAFEKACRSLRDIDHASRLKEIAARKIVELASRGERDPDALCNRSLDALFPQAG
jgi:hypothetical protein